MRFGIQMYGANPLFLQDKEAFLRRVSQAGYRYLEPRFSLKPVPGLEDRIWLLEDFRENVPLMAKYGMGLYSVHIYTENLPEDLGDLIVFAREFNVKQFVIPCPREINPAMAVDLTKSGDILRAHGIDLLLHNGQGDLGYGWLLMASGDSVGAQLDVGWLKQNGTDLAAFLKKNGHKVRSLHYKDFDENGNEVPIGTGTIDMEQCFQFSRAREIPQISDQNASEDILRDLEATCEKLRGLAQCRSHTESQLCLLDTETGDVKVLKTYERIIEAPNWMQQDPDKLIYNSDGKLYRYSIASGEDVLLDTGHCTNCNNDHVLSPDEKKIAVSHAECGWDSRIYILPIDGGTPRQVTPNAPSYLHGWSPDGKELCYCAFREDGGNVFAISADGGEEWQLTKNAGFNDGPEYALNGDIWFNSTRTGLMQCWKMARDGSGQTQMTFSERNNWFPHVSPDGKKVVYLSYSAEGLDADEHLPNMNVQLRLMDADGSNDRMLLSFFGGQGSVNVNSWHRDSRQIAFVRYDLKLPH